MEKILVLKKERKRISFGIGDVFEAILDNRTVYIQYLGKDPTGMFPVIRVFTELSLNPDSILFSEVCFGINPPIRNGDFRLIQSASQVNPPMGPFIEQKIRLSPTGIVTEQWISYENGERKELGKILPDKYLKTPRLVVYSWFTLMEAIESGEIGTLAEDLMF